ncbi:Methyltransf-25 domain-containing protein [Mycena kentingensis (nom. inval.)]|nr:Methyltransf-25 domain-containing protein [Mycena kentingensis (nom. inval.)]
MKPDYSKFTAEDTAKMEEITGIPARAMLAQTGLLPSPPAGALVLDNACGGGVVAQLLFNELAPGSDLKLVCGDLEEYMVESTKGRIAKNGWNAEALVVDAQAISFPDNHFTHAVMNFGIQVIPDQALAVKETFRVLRPGGVLGITSWTAPGWLDSMVHGCPGFAAPPLLTSGPTSTKESTTALLAAAGFPPESVVVTPVEFTHRDDVTRFLRYMGEIFKGVLGGEGGDAYAKYMREKYGDGEFELLWKAVVITATKPK